MKRLLGREVMFIPFCAKFKNGNTDDSVKPIRGMIDMVYPGHHWFRVRWMAGDTVQHECFHPFDIGKAVTILGNKKNH